MACVYHKYTKRITSKGLKVVKKKGGATFYSEETVQKDRKQANVKAEIVKEVGVTAYEAFDGCAQEF